MSFIKPTVGRVVHYTPGPTEKIPGNGSGQPLAALIAFVHSDSCVNLAVFDANGNNHSRTSVPLVQDDTGLLPEWGFAQWMPYQKGQAAKTEQLQEQLSVDSAAPAPSVSEFDPAGGSGQPAETASA
ncbi:MAG: hypothetical protein ABFC67_14830 [Mizugakiibacter sp.]|uniref:hypothetical protein n=1 Tax=Mizugakiibacter sp. TaxID=1972610 RepID=UPI00321035A6